MPHDPANSLAHQNWGDPFRPSRTCDSLSRQQCRVGSNKCCGMNGVKQNSQLARDLCPELQEPQPLIANRVAGSCTSGRPAPFQECRSGLAAFDALLQPVQHFALNPADPVRSEGYPLGECPGFLQSRHVLRRVQGQPLELAL